MDDATGQVLSSVVNICISGFIVGRGEGIDDESIEGVTSVVEAVTSLVFEVSDARSTSSSC